MNSQQFVEYGKAILKFVANKNDNIADLNVLTSLKPGYLADLIPSEAPLKGEKFEDILDDVKTKIVPGITNWHHPNFYAYFPTGHTYPSMLGELMNSGLGGLAFSWTSSPAFTELETKVLSWYAKAANLPLEFYNGKGGGAVHGSASESIFICLISARDRAISQLKSGAEDVHGSVFLPQLVAYSCSMAHSSTEKGFKMAMVKHRILEADSRGRMDCPLLRKTIAEDVANGLTPFFVMGTVGTTGGCAVDDLEEIGQICKENPTLWFHVDGAYGGSAFILPEMRQFMKGLEHADSFNLNPSKFMLITYDAAFMFVKDLKALKSAMTLNPLNMLENKHPEEIDYRDYGIPSGRRSRVLKIWFVFRSYGIEAIQQFMRNHFDLAKRFERHVRDDKRFEVMNDVYMGLVCFRLINSDVVNRNLLNRIQLNGEYHMIPATINGNYVLRFCLNYEYAKAEHIDAAWAKFQECATYVLANDSNGDDKKDTDIPFLS